MKNYLKLLFIASFSLLLSFCVSSHIKIKELYYKAKNYQRAGDTKNAIACYKTIINSAEKEELSPFLKVYYKAISYLEIGEEEKALKEIETISRFSPKYREEFLLLKSIYFQKSGFYEISKNISENLFNSKKREIKLSAAEIFSDSLISLLKTGIIDKKEYFSNIKKITKLLKKDFSSPLIHYYLFSLYLNGEEYKNALREAIISLDFGMNGELKRDLLFSIKFILKKLPPEDKQKYTKLLRRYDATNN